MLKHDFSFETVLLRLKQLGLAVTIAAAVITTSFGWKMGDDLPNAFGMAVMLGACTFVVGYGLVVAVMAQRRNLPIVAVAALAMTGVAGWGEWVAHTGANAANRDSGVAHATMKKAAYETHGARLAALQKDELRIQAKLGATPKYTQAEAEGIMKTAKAHKWWQVTNECTETKGPQTRAWCATFREAEASVSGWAASIGDSTELTRVQSEIALLTKDKPELAVATGASQGLILASMWSREIAPTKEQTFWASVGLSSMFALIAVTMGALLNLVAFAFEAPTTPNYREPTLRHQPVHPRDEERSASTSLVPTHGASTTLNMFGLANTDEILKKWAADARVGNLLKAA